MSIEQRAPVPALGDGWFLLRDDEVIKKGDMVTSCSDAGYTEAKSSVGKTRPNCKGILRAARYFSPTKEPEPAADAEPQPKPIDWTKPVRTKDGRAVRVLCTDGPGEWPVVGIVDGDLDPETWAIDGKWLVDDVNGRDLENAPQRIQKTWWMNVFDDGSFDHYETKELADADRGRGIFACVPFVLDCEEGEGL